MNEHFTKAELALMKGKYASLARKYDSTTTYVKLIANGERQLNSKLSKLIYEDIRKIIDLFEPIPKSEAQRLKNNYPIIKINNGKYRGKNRR